MTMTDPAGALQAPEVHEVEVVDGVPDRAEVTPGTALEQAAVAAITMPNIPGREEFIAMALQAQLFARSELVPKALRDRPADVLLVILTARDLDIPITAAFRTCYPIEGQVSLAPKLLVARIHKLGLGDIKPHAGNSSESASGTAYGPKGEELGSFTFTLDDARQAELFGRNCTLTEHKKGQNGKCPCKDNWRKYPQRMLWWRVVGYLTDDHFPESSYGIFQPDELGAVTDENGIPIDPSTIALPLELAAYNDPRPGEPAADTLLHPVDQREVWIRLASLDHEGKVLARDRWDTARLPKLADLTTRKLGAVNAILAGVESDRRAAGYDLDAGRLAAEAEAARRDAAAQNPEAPTPDGADPPNPSAPEEQKATDPPISVQATASDVAPAVEGMSQTARDYANRALVNAGLPPLPEPPGHWDGKIIAAMQHYEATVLTIEDAISAYADLENDSRPEWLELKLQVAEMIERAENEYEADPIADYDSDPF
jgi:hypothetical protein